MNNDIEKDAAEPCPFCGAEAQPNDGDHVVSHSDFCFLTHHYAQETWLLGKRKLKLWNTRATAADKERITALETELAAKTQILTDCLREMPVGYIPAHTAESLPGRIKDLASELAAKTQECEGLTEEVARLKRNTWNYEDSARKEGE